jgi:uncharacterized membrane protein
VLRGASGRESAKVLLREGLCESPTIFIRNLLTTSSGHKLILVGSTIGLLFGIVVLRFGAPLSLPRLSSGPYRFL